MPERDWIVISGNANRSLSEKISERLGKPLAQSEGKRFSDGEISFEIQENARGRDAYVIQSLCPTVNDNLMELLIMIDALKRASAHEISVIVPYYGYARQDRKVAPRTPISAKLVADLLEAAGADRVIAMDLHAGQIQGFFNVPFDNLFAMPVFLDYVQNKFRADDSLVVVSPDSGGVERSRAYAKRMDASLAIIDKRRLSPNQAKAMNIIGDVEGKKAIIVDDIIDTAGTLTQASQAVLEHGATEVYAMATHGLLSGPAVERIEESPIQKIIVTDTIPLNEKTRNCSKLEQRTVAPLIAEAIHRVRNRDSVSSLFV